MVPVWASAGRKAQVSGCCFHSSRRSPHDSHDRLAETKAGEMLARLSKEMFRDCGVRIFVMYGYKDTHNQTCVAK